MRIAIDMQGALTDGSRPRGIGRFTHHLVDALAGRNTGHDLTLMLNANHETAPDKVEAQFSGRAGIAVSRYVVPFSEHIASPKTSPRRRIADAIVRRHAASLEPDVVLITSVFEQAREDFSPIDLRRYPGRLKVAILYDLIPLVFETHYLAESRLKTTYYEMVETLKSADLLLSISDSARDDAIRFLGIEPDRVVNISAAADKTFRPLTIDPDRRDELARDLGLTRPFVVYVAGADMRKNLRGAVEAFAALPALVREAHQLLLVTRLEPRGAADLQAQARGLGIERDGLVLARDVGPDDLVTLMNMARALVFPSLYEGFGLPVLEAMQCGTPVVAAHTSSIPEIVDRGDILFPVGDPSEAGRILSRVLTEEGLRSELEEWGLQRAKKFTWEGSAARAIEAIEQRLAALSGTRPGVLPCEQRDLDGVRTEFAEILAHAPECDPEVESYVGNLLSSVREFSDGRVRRLLIDVSDCRLSPAWTGIQRVVRKLTTAFYDQGSADYDFVPLAIRLDGPEPESAQDFVALSTGRPSLGRGYPVEIRRGDDLFMLDSNWVPYPSYLPLFEEVRGNGGRLFTCVYDIIPELHPDLCGEGMPEAHARWLHAAIAESDGLICISRAVADEVADYIDRHDLPHRRGLKIGWFHCGSDIRDLHASQQVRADVERAFAPGRPTFVAVGTLEPRKAHALALDGFERLWDRGVDVGLCFIGARGWKIDQLEQRIRSHPEHGKRLNWFVDAKDADVSHAYLASEAILAMSVAEGFGLPIAEAARIGRPVICSDIPVFREVGRDGAVYFRAGDPESLAEVVTDWLAGSRKADPTKVSRSSWNDAARRVSDIIYREEWHRRID